MSLKAHLFWFEGFGAIGKFGTLDFNHSLHTP